MLDDRASQQVAEWHQRRHVAVRPWQLPVILLGSPGRRGRKKSRIFFAALLDA